MVNTKTYGMRTRWWSDDLPVLQALGKSSLDKANTAHISAGYMVQDDGPANLISSLGTDGKHYPVLDLDVPHKYVMSSKPGHGHLFINRGMHWSELVQLLDTLANFSIIEHGFAESSKIKGMSQVRVPGVFKQQGDYQVLVQDLADKYARLDGNWIWFTSAENKQKYESEAKRTLAALYDIEDPSEDPE